MQVVGIGTGGSQIAALLANKAQYKAVAIDSSLKDEIEHVKQIKIEEQESFKDYEEKTTLDLSSHLRYNDVHVFLFGGGKTTGCVLKVLESIKDKKITINYVSPEQNFLSNKQKLRERATQAILQEFARSGVFRRINLFNTSEILKTREVSFIEKKEVVAKEIADIFHMINYFKNTEGIFSNTENPSEINRICSFGVVNPENGEEILYFPLDTQREKCYYFIMNQDSLRTPGLVEKINDQLKREDASCSFKIVQSEWETNHVYVEAFTNVVQTSQNQTEE